MSQAPSSRLRLPGPPIWLQIITLVVGALIAAQLVTLALTLLLPPAPPPQHSLAEIAQALRGAPRRGAAAGPYAGAPAAEPRQPRLGRLAAQHGRAREAARRA
jgi:hypothetical protein